MSLDNAFKIVSELAKDFKTSEQHYLNPSYSEADVRNDFINKFFIALGWDVRHETQKNPYEQEVRVEKAVQIAKAQKRADYSFAIAPNFRTVKFFVEAKKPAHALENKDFYFQTARYGWNANTPIAVLTDFEEFHIIDCRFRPNINDALNYKIEQFRYTDYIDKEKFAKIYYLFSRESVIDNSIEKYVDALPKLRGKKAKAVKATVQSIDESFLEELDEIRNDLAKSFKKNNTHLSSEELTEATQRTIDRLVFIKFLEDKLIEPDHYVSEFGGRRKAWEDFITASRTLDAKYNGVVFKKSLIDTRNVIEPDDKTFSAICEELSHENTPYNFDAIPIHILGSIYERFLGKVVNATDKRVTIEEKPEVRKAGGVYYTPQYIVNYIADNTVGKLIEGKTPKEIAKLRFADIACGSGSFLITVFERLLDYHKRWYIENPEQAKKDGCILLEGTYHLSLKQKTKILLNNVYGVDIDQQAVEVTQLSLYLKLLEDETTATANDSWVMFKEQLLPDLNKNIVCGNSLIGTDILNPTSFLPFNKGEDEGGVDELKLKPMDFETVFPEVMKSGGFDAIVGNPPYVSIEFMVKEIGEYFLNNYKTAYGRVNSFSLFFERYLAKAKKGALCGFIISNRLFTNTQLENLREILLKETSIQSILSFKKAVFKAAVDTSVLVFKNIVSEKSINILVLKDIINLENKVFEKKIIPQEIYLKTPNYLINLDINPLNTKLLTFIEEKSYQLENICDIKDGIILGSIKELFLSDTAQDSRYKKFLDGNCVTKYSINWDGKYICYDKDLINKELELKKKMFKKAATIKETKKKQRSGVWLRDPEVFEQEKIITRQNAKRIIGTLDLDQYYVKNSLHNILKKDDNYNLKFILAILNSKLMDFYFQNRIGKTGEIFSQMKIEYLKKLPIIKVNFDKYEFKSEIEKIISLVDQMLTAKKQLQQAKTESDKTYLERKCATLDKQIDELVYQLYGLTEEEIKIVEGKSNP